MFAAASSSRQRPFATSTSALVAPRLGTASRPPAVNGSNNLSRHGQRWSTPPLRRLMIQAQAPTDPPEDFEPVPDEHAKMGLTDTAVKQLLKAQEKASDSSLALRVLVESGGCHGYQYKMQMTSQREPDDYVFQAPDSSARLFVDAASLTLLSGSKIDYATELIGSSFRVVDNPHADHGAGCGCGVSWDLKPL
ncbi:[4Fe-4S] proteins maturation [Microbotryomycetes sp. JL201]|nr:[4Fe-4S] proteins maturation [Microbotryomycetes sp. JL201]